MPSTLLAVDDSVTMRKVLEITFAGPEFRVVTAPTSDAALQKLKSDKPDLVICDLTLDPKNSEAKSGYDLCKAIKQASPQTPVLLLSSKQNPFDAGKGSGAQADDHIDKPFDTQQMIDKVKKMLSMPATAAVGARPAAAASLAPAPAATAPAPAPVAAKPAPAPSPASVTAPMPAGPSPTMVRAKTLIYNPPPGVQGNVPGMPVTPQPATRPPLSPTPVTGLPMQAREAPAPAAHAPVAAAPAPVAAAAINGQMAGKLEGLGLSPAQVEAVMAISREVVERVVWEVVPVLAETIIKEGIARLTK